MHHRRTSGAGDGIIIVLSLAKTCITPGIKEDYRPTFHTVLQMLKSFRPHGRSRMKVMVVVSASCRLFLLLLAAVTLAACSGSSPQPDPLGEASPYLIEPIFQEFYEFLGGQDRLGVALTPVIIVGN
ncbi:MAG TPA: hypothetical protein VIH42_11415, partial [Thermoguttaceae bacterium]